MISSSRLLDPGRSLNIGSVCHVHGVLSLDVMRQS